MYLLTALLALTYLISTQNIAMASDSSICNSITCENPQTPTVLGGNLSLLLDRQAPITFSSFLNTWNQELVLIPLTILVFFQIGEKRISKHFNPRK
jgi:hypothetical protein